MAAPGDNANVPGLQTGLGELNVDSQLSSIPTDGISLLEIIFSCQVCQATVDTIYSESDRYPGYRTTSDSGEVTVVKLWLTDCHHLICGKHLEGGGTSFHPAHDRPRAQCPICWAEKRDAGPKNLYAVRGLRNGEFDHNIPPSYFQLPPAGLDASNANMEAVKFHYLALLRYSLRIRDRVRFMKHVRDVLQIELKVQRETVSGLATELATAQRDIRSFQTTEALNERTIDRLQGQKGLLEVKVQDYERESQKWELWKAREAEIIRDLNLVAAVARENSAMRETLSAVGVRAPDTDFARQLFNADNLLPTLQQFDRGPPQNDVAVEEYGVLADGNGRGGRRGPSTRPAIATEAMPTQSPAMMSLRRIQDRARAQQATIGETRNQSTTVNDGERHTTRQGNRAQQPTGPQRRPANDDGELDNVAARRALPIDIPPAPYGAPRRPLPADDDEASWRRGRILFSANGRRGARR